MTWPYFLQGNNNIDHWSLDTHGVLTMKNVLFIAINKLIYHFRVDLGDGNGDDCMDHPSIVNVYVLFSYISGHAITGGIRMSNREQLCPG